MLTIMLTVLLLDADANARAALALAAARSQVSMPQPAVKEEVQPAQPKEEMRPARPQGRPVMGPAGKRSGTPVVVRGDGAVEYHPVQPLRWVAEPRWNQLCLMQGGVQVGAYNTRTKTYRPYSAAADEWGEPEEPPVQLPRTQSAAPTVQYRSSQSC